MEKESVGGRRFVGRRGDLTWGKFDYPVTKSQKSALDGLWYMMTGLPRQDPPNGHLPQGLFYSQRPDTGVVIIGLHQYSVNVHRSGLIVGNQTP